MRFRSLLAVWLLSAAPTVALARPAPVLGTATFRYIQRPGGVVPMSRADRDGPQPKQSPLVPVPQARQHSASACGLGLAQMLCGYYKPEMPRGSVLVKQAKGKGYTYEYGTPTPGLRQLLGELGFTVKTKRHMTLGELVDHVNRGDPVGVGAQAWADRPVNWKTVSDAGHYMLVIGFGNWKGKPYTSARKMRSAMKKDPNNAIVWLADPAMSTGRRGWMPLGEFLERWHWPREKQLGIVARPENDTGARACAFLPATQRIR
jgi:hypothetical protein